MASQAVDMERITARAKLAVLYTECFVAAFKN